MLEYLQKPCKTEEFVVTHSAIKNTGNCCENLAEFTNNPNQVGYLEDFGSFEESCFFSESKEN